MSVGLVVDLFAGAGGASVGLEAALGRPVDVAINHNAVAMAVHKANLIGNSVSPETAQALVAANLPQDAEAVA